MERETNVANGSAGREPDDQRAALEEKMPRYRLPNSTVAPDREED